MSTVKVGLFDNMYDTDDTDSVNKLTLQMYTIHKYE